MPRITGYRPRLTRLLAALAALTTATPDPAAAEKTRRPSNLHQLVSTPQSGGEMVSWVVLSNSTVELDVDTLRAKLDKAFPGEFVPQRDQGSFVIEGPIERSQFLIQSRVPDAPGTFMLNSVPGPYTKFSDFAKFIEDRSLQRRAQAQRSWLSIDLIAKHTTEDEAYRFIGRALAVLAPPDAAFLVHPVRPVVIVFNDDVRRRLASGEPMLDAKREPK